MDASCPNPLAELEVLPPLSYFLPASTTTTTATTSGLAAAAIPVANVPAYSSLPGAADTLYLDFNGHFEATWGSYSNVTTPAYSTDADLTTFSDQEQLNIQSVWAQVAEDYAPFNINVTTVEPASFANGVGLRVAIGGSSSDWFGSAAGGVGYINSYTNSIVNTVYVFPAQLGNGTAKYVGEASSHEAGHAFGLQHQSQYDANGALVASYYAGANGVAPIMGNSYSSRGVWWNGTSTSATTIQDDMSQISRSTNTFGYRADDYGNTAATAFAFSQTGSQLQAAGVITQTTDVDVFAFSTNPGTVSFTVAVPTNNNLDSVLELQDAGGTVLASAAPTTSFGATLSYAITTAGSFRIAVKSQGNYGDVGQYTVSGTIVPNTNTVAAPTSLTAAASGTSVALNWTDNATNETGYVVQRTTNGGTTWSVIATLAADSRSYTDTTGSAGATLGYRVQAVNAAAVSAYSNTASVTFAPAAPTGLTATAASSTAINLAWTDVAGETGYKILRSTDNVTFTQVGTVAAGVTTYSSTGLTANTRYYYVVVANNAGGDSARSASATAVTLAATITVPTAPSNLTATATAANSVTLRWSDRSNNETGFYVERRTGNNGPFTRIATVNANATTYTDATTVRNTRYQYRVLAFNSAGVSAASRNVTVTTPSAALPAGAATSTAAVPTQVAAAYDAALAALLRAMQTEDDCWEL